MPEDHGPRAFEAGSYDVLAARLGHAGAYGLEAAARRRGRLQVGFHPGCGVVFGFVIPDLLPATERNHLRGSNANIAHDALPIDHHVHRADTKIPGYPFYGRIAQ